MISDFFIARPVLANVLAIVMMVVGAVALLSLPVAQYPNVVPPTVQVTTRYPGASARTVIDTVALPIEQQVNGVEGMIYMQSYSGADGSYSLTVTFGVGNVVVFGEVRVMIWRMAVEFFCTFTPCACTACGNEESALETRFCTRICARLRSVPTPNVTVSE